MQLSAPRRRRWPVVLACLAAGMLLGALFVIVAPALIRGDSKAPALPQPASHVAGKRLQDGPRLEGDLFTTIKNFKLDDPEGNTVLTVAEIGAFMDLDSLGSSESIRIPRGHASDVSLLLRRGPSGRVSLSEAFRGNSEPHEPSLERGGTRLQLGPLQVTNVQLTVAMGGTPVVIHIDRAVVRVQRKIRDLAPRVFLSGVHGNMVSPDPLSQPIAIEGAEGVVDLASDPLIDLRARVCIGDSELRIRIKMPERRHPVQMTVDANDPLAKSALVALNLVSVFKSDKLHVVSGEVSVEEAFDCTRTKGRTRRSDMQAGIDHSAKVEAKRSDTNESRGATKP